MAPYRLVQVGLNFYRLQLTSSNAVNGLAEGTGTDKKGSGNLNRKYREMGRKGGGNTENLPCAGGLDQVILQGPF